MGSSCEILSPRPGTLAGNQAGGGATDPETTPWMQIWLQIWRQTVGPQDLVEAIITAREDKPCPEQRGTR